MHQNEKLLFLGDLFYDYDYIADDIEDLSRWIHENNFAVVANMEGSVFYDTKTPLKKRGPNLASNKTIVDVLHKLNVKGVCLANNHSMDFGGESLIRTIQTLKDNNIAYCGAGQNIIEALQPMEITVSGKKYSILNFGWDIEETVYATGNTAGCAPRINKVVIECVKKEIEKGNTTIVCFHWGFEYNRLPMPMDIDLAHQVIDCGAEMVIGHHPHCVQPKEYYKDRVIFYSLGNFYFSSRRKRYQKRFNEVCSNQSDFGLMVSQSNGQTSEYIIEYNYESDSSFLSGINTNYVLEDITGVDYSSNDYVIKAKHRKINRNPILTLDEAYNKRELSVLFLKYKILFIIRKILRK